MSVASVVLMTDRTTESIAYLQFKDFQFNDWESFFCGVKYPFTNKD
jgi:hypothetical protein